MYFLFILLNAYFVSFTDKPTKTAPQLSPRAVSNVPNGILRRTRWIIPFAACI